MPTWTWQHLFQISFRLLHSFSTLDPHRQQCNDLNAATPNLNWRYLSQESAESAVLVPVTRKLNAGKKAHGRDRSFCHRFGIDTSFSPRSLLSYRGTYFQVSSRPEQSKSSDEAHQAVASKSGLSVNLQAAYQKMEQQVPAAVRAHDVHTVRPGWTLPLDPCAPTAPALSQWRPQCLRHPNRSKYDWMLVRRNEMAESKNRQRSTRLGQSVLWNHRNFGVVHP